MEQTWPQVQLALDLVRLQDAVRIARMAVSQGIGWLEAGTPLIKSEGMKAVKALSRNYDEATVVADMKTLDAGSIEAEMAFHAGARVVSISGLAHDRTVRDAVRVTTQHDGMLMADLLMAPNPLRRARELENLGVDIVCIHTGVDVQKAFHSKLKVGRNVRKIAKSVNIPVAAAGGVNPRLAGELLDSGVKIIVVGGWITGSKDPSAASRRIMQRVEGSARLGPV